MPRGYPNAKAAPAASAAPVVPEEPAPMIFIEPAADGSIRLNAYGLHAFEVVDVLQRSLLHLVASQAGVQVISLEAPARAAAVVAARPAQAAVSRNGAVGKMKPPASSKPKRLRSLDERDEDYFTDGIETAVGDER